MPMAGSNKVFTVPNILSMFRLVLIPIYATMYLHAETWRDYFLAAAVLAVSTVTDFFDGIIARKCNMISKLGIALDPVADKATQGILIICLGIRKGNLALWLLFGLFVIKEGFMLVMGVINLKRGKMLKGAIFTGKISTTVLFVSMIVLVLFSESISPLWVDVLVIICAVFMLISLITYIPAYFSKNNKLQSVKAEPAGQES